ncbi:MAG: hypothetical protein PHW34_09195 [Hespellia sp.]|nr:hypothetical protein [Hespellia sp.]
MRIKIKKKKLIVIFLSIVLILAVILMAFVWKFIGNFDSNVTGSENNRSQIESETVKLSAEETVKAYAQVIYTYSTTERYFYEGAEEYMTKAAYRSLVPMTDAEANGEEIEAQEMHSQLQDIVSYYRPDGDDIHVLSEVHFTLSGSGEYKIRHILKMKLIQQDGWKISECSVLDTMEE